MPNYQWKCEKCDDVIDYNVPSKDRDTFTLPCDCCGTNRVRLFGMPMVMKAAYPDGTKREGWADMLATAKLEEAKANKKWGSDERKAIDKELDEREQKTKK